MTALPTTDTDQSPPVQLTEEGLRRLLADAARGQLFLPPGAYRDEAGQVWRDVQEPTGRTRKNKTTGLPVAINRLVKRPVYLTSDTSREGLIAAREVAARRGMDFYWSGPAQGVAVGCAEPGTDQPIGWLKYGTKRATDVPVNLGAGAEMFTMVEVPIEEPEDIGSTTSVMQGVAVPTDEPTEAPEPAPERRSHFTDEALEDIPVSTRAPRKGG